jgi:hypothetical protein
VTADLGEMGKIKNNMEEIRTILADIIVKWNTTMQYHNSGNIRKKQGNCQDFTEVQAEAFSNNFKSHHQKHTYIGNTFGIRH